MDFIKTVAEVAVKDWKERRIMLPSVVIAQAILESGWGKSELATEANALFGIKKNGWTGKTYVKDATEQNKDGSYRIDENELWRAYDSWAESIIDHNTYIATRALGAKLRYEPIIGNTDPVAVCNLLQSCGYATSLTYPEKLMRVINEYMLTQYDDIKEEAENMVKIALDAGHGLNTSGKQTPDGIKEWTINDKVRDKVVAILSDYDVEIIHTDNNEGKTDEGLSSRLNTYKKAGVKAFVSIHHNAFTGSWGTATGVEVYTDKNPTAADVKLANAIYSRLVKYTGLKGRGVKNANFTVINQNTIPAVLVEGGFMDSTKDYKIITSDVGQTAYAKAVAEGLIEFLGLKKKSGAPEVSAPVVNAPVSSGSTKTLYKVQCGAFSSRSNAETLQKLLRAAGFDAVIVNG